MTSIGALLVEIDERFRQWGVKHAFGGAMALNFYAEPRATVDIDVNVATNVAEARELIDLLREVGFELEQPLEDLIPAAGARARRASDVVDLFFAFDEFHRRLLERARRIPIRVGGALVEVPVLSADDLVVVKMSFNRGKDWVDIEAMVNSGTPIDITLVERELIAFRGPTMYPRLARLRQMLAEHRRDVGE